MYRTKQSVDKHVTNVLGRLKDEKERNGKGYLIAKLYYDIKEYETSRRYLAGFLSLNEKFAPAHKLLGQLLEALCHTEKAIESFKRSYELDDRQKDVLLKICELYCEVDIDADRAQYWADKAEKLFPKNDIVFRLRERIYSDGGAGNAEELENLIASELAKRPGDPILRSKLVKLYLETGRVNEAYSHAVEVENKVAYPDSLDWYQCLLEVFQTYSEQGGSECSAFHRNLLAAQNTLVALSLEKAKVSDCADILHKFDQCLYSASKLKSVAAEMKVFLEEMQAQFYTHAGTLLLKRAQLDHLGWTDARNMSGACYLASYATAPFDTHAPWFVKASPDEKRVHTNLYNMACYRAGQAGHMINNVAIGDRHRWKQMIKQDFLSNQGCEKIFDSLFTMRQMKGTKESSFLMKSEMFMSFTPQLPSETELKQYDVAARRHKSDHLHVQVWLSLQYYSSRDDTQPYYGDTVFDDLQYSTGSLDTAAPETLCQLDIQAFLYAVVRCTAVRLDTRDRIMPGNSGQPSMFPASLSEALCTPEQAEWWTTSYKLYKNTAKEQLAKCRLILQRGLEAIRLVRDHGVKPALVVHLAMTFEEQVQDMKSRCVSGYSSNAADVERQASHYWNVAIRMLTKMNNNVGGASPKNCLFKYEGPALSDVEVKKYLDEGRYFMACQAMDAGCGEEAIEEFSKLGTADAAYHVAQLYRGMAEEELVEASRNDVQHPSGMQQHTALLEKARDTLYLCLDRIGSNRHHKLNAVLAADIDEVEAKINRMGLSPGAGATDQSVDDDTRNKGTPVRPTAKFNDAIKHSTPSSARHALDFSYITSNHATTEHPHIAPSPERLDAQLRALASSNNAILKRNEELVASNSSLVDEIKQLHQIIKKLEEKIDKVETQEKAKSDAVQSAEAACRAAAAPQFSNGSPAISLPPPAMATSISGHITSHGTPRPHLTPVRHLPTHPAGSPYYGYRPPEYEYPPYYPMYAPPPQPPIAAPYGYPAPAIPHALYKPPPVHQSLTGDHHADAHVDVEDEDDYYYEDDDDGETNDENIAYSHQQRAAYHIPEQQLIQDWPYGSSVGMEGKSTLTYAPGNPAAVPPHATYFSQIPPQQGIPGIFGQPPPAVTTPPMPGPGYFSSPERPVATYGPRYPAASACAVQPAAAGASVPVPLSLEPPKPGFVSITQPGHSAATAASFPGMPARTTLVASTAATATVPAANITTGSLHMFKDSTASVTSPPVKPATAFPIRFAANPVPVIQNEEAKSIIQSVQPEDADDDDVNEDSYQGPDFEPIIPLPAEVSVETGEEDESVLFTSRAKLYRFTENQWKERGLGDLKILFNDRTGQARIVMRREQVLKVCANHYLTEGMTVDFKSVSDRRVLNWIATDFTEGEPVMEKFCVRFKTEDLGSDFKENFEIAVKRVAEQKPTTEQPKPTSDSAKVKEDLFAKFKPKAGSWECNGCYVNNAADVLVCPACATLKPGTEASVATSASATSSITTAAGGGFKFGGSPAAPASTATSSFKFGSTVAPTASPVGFGASTSTPTGFGIAPKAAGFSTSMTTSFSNVASTTVAPVGTSTPFGFGSATQKTTTTTPFAFGSPSMATSGGSAFGFSTPTSKSDASKPAATQAQADSTSGSLSSLFQPKSGTWVCDMCLVQNAPEDTVCMACEKPCPTAECTDASKPTITTGSAGGFKFGSPNAATAFRSPTVFGGTPTASPAAAKSVISPPKLQIGGAVMTSAPAFGVTSTTVSTTPASKSMFGSAVPAPAMSASKPVFGSSMPVFGGITPLSTTPATTTSTAKPVFGGAPAIFGTATTTTTTTAKPVFGGAAPVFGTAATTFTTTAQPVFGGAPVFGTSTTTAATLSSTTAATSVFGTSTTTAATSTSSTFVFGGTKPASAFSFTSVKFGDASSSSAPASDMLKSFAQKSKESSSDVKVGETQGKDNKPKVGGFTFNAAPVFQDDGAIARTTIKASPHKDATPPTEEKKNPFASFSFSPTKPVSTAATTVSDKMTFGSSTATSFATLAAGAEGEKSPSFTKKSDFAGFSGAGQQLFQVKSPGGEETVEEYEPEVDFKPIVPLPDLVEVRTGEEEEEKLFCQRARLYRHDPDTKQWKERGVGDIKILKNPTTGRCRILMRREQVLKLCANHPITADMILKPMMTSEKAWCWVAQDYSEEEMKTEQLAIRFKTVDLAKEFKEVFEDCQTAMKENPPLPEQPARADESGADKSSGTHDAKKGFGDVFKLKSGDWECQGCYIQNAGSIDRCPACDTARPGAAAAAATPAPDSTKPKPITIKLKTDTTAKATGFGNKFKPKTGDWECSGCYINNATSVNQCPACNTMKPGAVPEQSSEISSSTTSGTGFGAFKFGASGSGFTFGTPPKPATDASGFKFGTPSSVDSKLTGGFTFGTPSQASTASSFGSLAKPETAAPKAEAKGESTMKPGLFKDTPKVTVPPSTGFTFGMSSSTFTFTPTKPADSPLDLSQPKSPQSPGEDGYYVHDEGEHITFEPLVSLEKVEVTTGEEDETTMYSHRAKVFRFVNSEWKERGIGDVKILKHKETNKSRIVMRREQILKLCLNHAITADLELKEMANAQGKAWVWHAEDFSESEGSHEKFAIKFRSMEIANEFKEAFENAKANASGSLNSSRDLDTSETVAESAAVKDNKPEGNTSLQGFSFKLENTKSESPAVSGFASSTPTADTSSTFGTAKGFTLASNQAKMTPTSVADSSSDDGGKSPHARARSLLMSLLDQPADEGDEDDVIIVGEEKPAPEKADKARQFQLPCNFYSYEDKASCPGCIGCADEDSDVIFVQEEIPSDEKIALAERYQLPRCFYLFENRAPCQGCIGCDEEDLAARGITLKKGSTSKTKKQSEPAQSSSSETSKKQSETSEKQSETKPDSTTSEPIIAFGKDNGSDVSFAALSSQAASGLAFGKKSAGDGDKPFSFAGAGTSIFGQANTSATEDGEEGDVAPSNDIHFEPLVDLPEVEVKTGEEDEIVLYSQRSKLFRFTNDQWKERGIGEMKLLRHAETGKIRVLMRREQIHKIACNHQLTTEMELKPLTCSEVSYCWNALDFAENEPKLEKFAIKFKTSDLAQRFKVKFEECQEEIANMSSGVVKVDDKATHSEDSEEEDSIITPSSATTGDTGHFYGMAVSESLESDGYFKSLEAHIVSESKDSVVPTPVEDAIVAEPAFFTGDRGNPYYAAQLNSSVESPISAEVAYVTGDRGNPYYAEELGCAASFFGEDVNTTENVNYTGDAEESYNTEDSDNERPDHFRSLEAHISQEETRDGSRDLSESAEIIEPVILDYTGDAGNPYYINELNRHGERSRNYVETHESNLVTAYTINNDYQPTGDAYPEDLITASSAYTTGDQGNVYYAAELGLKQSDENLQQLVEDQLLGSGYSVEAEPAEDEAEISAGGDSLGGASGCGVAADSSILTEDQEEENEDDDDEDVQPLFTKRVTMSHLDGDQWQEKGMGELKVLYDDDVNGMRISMQTDDEHPLANHIICQEHNLQANEKKRFCEWTAKDFSTNDPVKRTFRVKFSSPAAVQEFRQIFGEGKNMALDSDLREVADISGEIVIPEISGVPQEEEESYFQK